LLIIAGRNVEAARRNGKLPIGERPFRVLIISGSDRRQYNCPGMDSEARTARA
jgi:hypothetical protein